MSGNPIQDNFVILCHQLDIERILPFLRQAKMLTQDEYEILSNPCRSVRQRREQLLLILPRKGRDHFQLFGCCLVWSGQLELASKIGIDVGRVPPPPSNMGVPPPPSNMPAPPSDEQKYHVLKGLITPGHVTGHVIAPPDTMAAPPTTAAYPHSTTLNPSVSHTVTPPQPPKVRRPASGKTPTVFILYCRDPNLGRTQYEFCQNVLGLADMLNRSGGIMCEYDGYDKHSLETNWSLWTERMILESDFVLLVCSPALNTCLQNPTHELVNMDRGKFYADAVVNHIDPTKVIPVFLNASPQLQWVPTNLHAATHYELKVDDLITEMGDTDGMLEAEFTERLGERLQEAKFQDITKLLAVLRGDAYNPHPSPPLIPVVLPRPPQPDSTHPYPYHPPFAATLPMTPPTATPTMSMTQQPDYISDGDLLKIAERLPRDWQHLGIKLGISYSALETLRAQYPFDTRMATLTMFGTWQQLKKQEATRKSLKQALISLGYGRVAKEVFPND